MLHIIAERRSKMKDFDLQEEELKALNNVRIINDGGWVCDEPTLLTVLDNSGI